MSGYEWKRNPYHRSAFLDEMADQIKKHYNGNLKKVPAGFASRFAKHWMPIAHRCFGQGNGIDCGAIDQQVAFAIDKQSIGHLAETHRDGLVLRSEYRIELRNRGIKIGW